MKYIVSLDLSLSNTGISIFSNDGIYVLSQSIDTKLGANHQEKLKIIGDSFLKLRKKYDVKKIIIEQGFSKFAASTQAIFKVNGLVQYLFYDVEQVFLTATTVKKEITGKGNAKKDEVRDSILKNNPSIVFDDFDQSDSYAIGLTYFRRKGIL